MFFTHEKKKDTTNQKRERYFFMCERNDTSNEKPKRCVSFAPKFLPFTCTGYAGFRTHSTRKFVC